MQKRFLLLGSLLVMGILAFAIVVIVAVDWFATLPANFSNKEESLRIVVPPRRAPPPAATLTGRPVARMPAHPSALPARWGDVKNIVSLPLENANSVSDILDDLRNPDRTIRLEAIERAKQIEDQTVIPALCEIANGMEEPHEHAALLDAIDFIKLPSLDAMPSQGVVRAQPGVVSPTQAVRHASIGIPRRKNVAAGSATPGANTTARDVPAEQTD